MVVHRAHRVTAGHQLGMHRIHGLAVLEVKSEVGTSRGVRRTEQGHPIAGHRRLQVGPVGRIPGELKSEGLIEGLGTLHVGHPEGYMAKAMDGGRSHGAVDHCRHSPAMGWRW